jgi:phosphatidylserine/phosphatidylglycerophosphate/cardiolipin synthase-like enzyme
MLLVGLLVWLSRHQHAGVGVDAAAPGDGTISVYFSPHGGCRDVVIRQLDNAQSSIEFQAYTFSSYEIARALVAAHDRGVKVTAVLDEKAAHDQFREPDYIASHGIETYVDGQHPIAHNKVIVIDGITVITGSYNFTEQAEKSNAENLLVISGNAKLAAAFDANFNEHLGHSQAYHGSVER